MCPHDGAIEQQAFLIGAVGTGKEELFPDARFIPACKAFVDAVPFPEAFGELSPLAASSTDPDDTIDESAALSTLADIDAGTATQEPDDASPLAIGRAISDFRR